MKLGARLDLICVSMWQFLSVQGIVFDGVDHVKCQCLEKTIPCFLTSKLPIFCVMRCPSPIPALNNLGEVAEVLKACCHPDAAPNFGLW